MVDFIHLYFVKSCVPYIYEPWIVSSLSVSLSLGRVLFHFFLRVLLVEYKFDIVYLKECNIFEQIQFYER